jgi:hypothetical protein
VVAATLMTAPSFYRTAYAKLVFTFVKLLFAATGVLFLAGAAMGLSDAALKTHFGYRLSDGLLGVLGAALTAFGWLFVGAIQRALLASHD